MLLANKAEVDPKAWDGSTPLHWAVMYTLNKDVVKLLLSKGAVVNAKDNNGDTPLHLAGKSKVDNGKDVAELLLATKAEVNAKNNNGETPLHLAMSTGHKEVAELIRQHGGTE